MQLTHWISTDKALPKEDGWYMVIINNERKEPSMFSKGEWWHEAGWSPYRGHDNVTHWVDTPKLPETPSQSYYKHPELTE